MPRQMINGNSEMLNRGVETGAALEAEVDLNLLFDWLRMQEPRDRGDQEGHESILEERLSPVEEWSR